MVRLPVRLCFRFPFWLQNVEDLLEKSTWRSAASKRSVSAASDRCAHSKCGHSTRLVLGHGAELGGGGTIFIAACFDPRTTGTQSWISC